MCVAAKRTRFTRMQRPRSWVVRGLANKFISNTHCTAYRFQTFQNHPLCGACNNSTTIISVYYVMECSKRIATHIARARASRSVRAWTRALLLLLLLILPLQCAHGTKNMPSPPSSSPPSSHRGTCVTCAPASTHDTNGVLIW